MSAKVLEIPRNPAALAPADLTEQELADEIGEHDREYQLLKPMLDRRDLLREESRARCENKPAKAQTILEGLIWRVTVKERGWRSTLAPLDSIHRAFRTAKKDFYAAISITQKAIEENLGKGALENLKRPAVQTGYRDIVAVLKVQPRAVS